MSDYSRPIGPRQPVFVERAYDSACFDGEWHRRERRREHYEDGSCSPWETLSCDPLLRPPAGQA
jgi:hypothetical protein